MKAIAVQMHLHGSMSEGPASCLAHDHMAAHTGHADVLWWTDHDFRVANFGKLSRIALTGLLEEVDHPNRNADAAERTVKARVEWKPVDRANSGETAPDQPLAHPATDILFGEGVSSLRFSLPARSGGAGERQALYELQMGAHYETFPLITHPVLRIALLPGEGVGPDAQVVIALTLSEQPPDLANTKLTYVLGGPSDERIIRGEHGAGEAIIPLPFTPAAWNEYTLDPLADVLRLDLRGGDDNSLHRIRVGVTSSGPPVTAHLGRFEVEVSHRGPSVLDLHRQLLNRLPTRVRHHVGLEVSYYGRHITGFGSTVPIPDYEALLPGGLTSEAVVEHIHRHGGLACLAHPSRVDPESTATSLAEQRLFGVDLMEVAHAAAGLHDRLQLWDRLAARGVIVTGIGVSDAHSAKQGWTGADARPVSWVTRVWAESDEEPDLLAALGRGRAFFSDPVEFRGDLWLGGPDGVEMGDILVLSSPTASPLHVRVSGAEAGDLVAWYVNGNLMHAAAVSSGDTPLEWQSTAPVDRLHAVRVELRRPRLANHRWGGLIACSNPIYLAPHAPQTTHRVLTAPSKE